jgi:hypothetical protein
VPCPLLIVGVLALATAPAPAEAPARAAPRAKGQPVRAVLLRPPAQIDATTLLEALQLRSPQRTLAVPPWPDAPADRFGLYAVATVGLQGDAVAVTLVLSDGRAYYRTLEASPDDAPRLAASTIANLLAAIEEDELPPDEEDVPLPPEQEPAPEPTPPEPKATPPKPAPKATPQPRPPEPRFLELEAIAAGTAGVALGPPSPGGFAGGGGLLGLELRWPTGALVSLTGRSHWHRPEPLTVGRTRISLGGGYAWRRGRFELRTVLALDVEPWGVRRDGRREPVLYPDGQRRDRGLQLGGHLRLSPSWRVPLGSALALRVGPRVELAGGALAQAAGVARLLVADAAGQPSMVARVGGLELSAGLELGLAWSLPRR